MRDPLRAQSGDALAAALHDGPPVEARPSASVVLIRGRRPWQALLMQRPRQVDFAAGAHVFPGGAVHAEDAQAPDPLRAAAIRELFEEVGILLARKGSVAAGAADRSRLAQALAGGLDFWPALAATGLQPHLRGLTLFTRWITPERLRRRFDTSFFLARLPAGQDVSANADEVAAWAWFEPQRALQDSNVQLVYATRHILAMLADEPDASRLIGRFRRRLRIPTVQPRIEDRDGLLTIVH